MKILDRILLIIALLGGALTAAQIALVLYIYIMYGFAADTSSVGIIGSSDGPTVIFVSNNVDSPSVFFIAALCVTVASTLALIIRKIRRS